MRLDHEASLCQNLEPVISLLNSERYVPWNLYPLGMIHDNCQDADRSPNQQWDSQNDYVNFINCLK